MLDNQFAGMTPPKDIKPLPKLTREEIQKIIKRDIDISKTIIISLNTKTFRKNEVNIHTADIGSSYEPDFDFSDLGEIDAWRKTCRLITNFERFDECNVDAIRCEGFFHKMQVCESLTLFEQVYNILKDGGLFIISVLDLKGIAERISQLSNTDSMGLYNHERILFSGTDSTGVYFNRTIWTFDRLKTYLEMAKFRDIAINENDIGEFKIAVVAKK